jgi:hypothetical protein
MDAAKFEEVREIARNLVTSFESLTLELTLRDDAM